MSTRRTIAVTAGFCIAFAAGLARAEDALQKLAAADASPARPAGTAADLAATLRSAQTQRPAVVPAEAVTPTQGSHDPAQAGHPAVVVELFTSQGCSSCPPADEVLGQLVGRKGVIPLALHVDYWDYIGWTDKFGSAANTARQKAYAQAIGSRTIYTPQMIIEGDDRVEGPRPLDVAELIQEHRAEVTPVSLSISREGDTVRIAATSSQPFAKNVLVELVRYLPEQTVTIARGENAGRTITYHNIVTAWQTVGTWDGTAPMELQATAAGSQPVVVIVQQSGPGEILAAAALR